MDRMLIPVLLAALTSCGPQPFDEYWPDPSPLGAGFDAARPPRDPDSPSAQPPPPPDPTGDLGIADAMALTLLDSPELAVFAWDIRAQEAALIQAALYPNPQLAVEIEDFGGSGDFSGFGASETTIALGQTILLGGKLSKRVAVARLERDLAGWDYEAARVDTLTRLARAFVQTLADQERLALAQEIEALAHRIFSAVSERVEAGKVSPVDRTRARIELAQATLDRQRAQRTLTAARHRLAANWGSVSPGFDRAVGELNRVRAPPPVEELAGRLQHNPDLARWATELALRRAVFSLARADRVPDVTLFAGPKLLQGTNETSFTAGASIPLPLLNRNQGGILEARVRHAQAGTLRRAAEVRVRTDLAASHQALDAAYVEILAIRDDVEPSARAAFEAAEEAFRQGKIGVLELLDSQRTLFGVRRQYVDALAAYHQAVIAVERLIGSPLHESLHDQRVAP